MEVKGKSMYESSSDHKPHGSQTSLVAEPLENDDAFYSVLPPNEENQVVPDRNRKDEEKRTRSRLRLWSYHCQVTEADVQMDKQKKLTENYKSLSEEEMRLLDEDIFNPLDICSIIMKNSKGNVN